MLERSFIPQLAFEIVKEVAKEQEDRPESLSNEILTQLHTFFGDTLNLACELLENCTISQYETASKLRKVYKIGSKTQQFVIYEDVNFCHCDEFQLHVLQNKDSLTCKHVLALKLNQIFKVFRVQAETVTDLQLVEFLNEQYQY